MGFQLRVNNFLHNLGGKHNTKDINWSGIAWIDTAIFLVKKGDFGSFKIFRNSANGNRKVDDVRE